MKWLKNYVMEYRWQFICGSGGKFLEALFEILVPTFVAAMVDAGVRGGDNGTILRYGILILVLSLLGAALAIYAQFQAAKASQGIGTAIRRHIWQVIQSQTPEERTSIRQDEIMTSITSDSEQVQLGIAMAIRLLLRAPFIVLGATCLAGILAPAFLWLFLLITAAMTLLLWLILRLMLPLYRNNQGILGRMAEQMADIGSGLRFVRGFRAFEREQNKAEELYQKGYYLADRVSFLQALLSPLSLLILNGSIIGLLYVGGLAVHQDNLTTGTLIALVNYMYQISAAVLVVSNVAGILSRAAAAAGRLAVYYSINEASLKVTDIDEIASVNETLNETMTVPLTTAISGSSGGVRCIEQKQPALVLTQLNYTYPGAAKPTLRDISLTVEEGQSLGITGQTGCGKSTLAQILAGLRKYDGRAVLTGSEIGNRRQMMTKVGYVSQKPAILSGSIRDNLCMADHFSDEQLRAALTAADAWEFVSRFESGLDHYILEEGKNLSGGQKQRIALARAILRKPVCLILDDTLSALDYRTIANVRAALRQMSGLGLLIMISQRVDHIKDMDRIAVLDQGCLAAFGDHRTLRRDSQLYREICDSQDVTSDEEADNE